MLAFAANSLLMLLSLATALGAFRKSVQRSFRLRSWGIAVVLMSAVCAFGLAFEQIRIDMDLYFVLAWMVIGPVSLISIVAEVRGKRPATGQVLSWLVPVGLTVFLVVPPMISTAKQAGRRVQCMQNLRNLGNAFPLAPVRGFPDRLANGTPPHSWRISAYSRDDIVGPGFDLDKSWSDTANLAVARERVGAFFCPANFNPKDDLQRYYTAYAAVTGPKTAFPDGKALAITQFTDGTSYTIVYGEAPGLQIVWTEPRDIDISRDAIGINLPGSRRGKSPGTLSSYHPSGGATVVFADGRVRFLSDQIDRGVLKALLTATGGESLSDEAF